MKCVACKTEIDDNAYKCKSCGTFQDWRRYVAFGNMLLALLVALVSVSIVFIPVLIKVFTGDRADIRVTVLDHGPSTFEAPIAGSGGGRTVRSGMTYTYRPQILIVNSGEGNGVIKKICISASITFRGNTEDIQYLCHVFKEVLVRPGVHRTQKLTFLLLQELLPREIRTQENYTEMKGVVGPLDLVGKLEVFAENRIGENATRDHPHAVIPVELKNIEYYLVEDETLGTRG